MEVSIFGEFILADYKFDKGQLYLFHFASDPHVNNNQTFIVETTTNISETNSIGFKGNDL